MKNPQNIKQGRLRLSRDENRDITRSKIIKMGRKHFLNKGYTGTVLEQVAEEAGFSRGALYSNFSGKEELFLEVFNADLHMQVAHYHDVLDGNASGEARIDAFREAFIDHVTDREWGVLRTEFELGAIRSEALRKCFAQVHRRDLENSVALAQKAADQGDLVLGIPADDFILATQSFMMGLAIKQRLLGRELSAQKVRTIASTFFDCFIGPPLKKGAERKSAQ